MNQGNRRERKRELNKYLEMEIPEMKENFKQMF